MCRILGRVIYILMCDVPAVKQLLLASFHVKVNGAVPFSSWDVMAAVYTLTRFQVPCHRSLRSAVCSCSARSCSTSDGLPIPDTVEVTVEVTVVAACLF